MFPRFLSAHYDGKIREGWGKVKSDYLALCVTGKGLEKEKLLGDIPMPKGTGLNMRDAIRQLFLDWGIDLDTLLCFNFDTTAALTGPQNGECVFKCVCVVCV